ncbi:anti-sigma-D factor RsdA [Gordonia sp. DT30]
MNDEHDRRRPMPDADPTEHIDLRQLHFDDAFLDALSHDVPTPTRDDTEYQLAALLSGWRHDVLAEPAPLLPGIAEVEHAMATDGAPRRGTRVGRGLRVIAGAAAIAVVAVAGLTVVSEGAQPGDSLWSVKKVVFADKASETQAAYDVRSDLEQAEAALASGDMVQAQQLIARAQTKMGPVRDAQTREQMNQWISRLRADESGAPGQSSRAPGPATTAPDSTSPQSGSPTPPTSDRSTTPTTTTPPTSTTPTSPAPTTPTPTSAQTSTVVPPS